MNTKTLRRPACARGVQ